MHKITKQILDNEEMTFNYRVETTSLESEKRMNVYVLHQLDENENVGVSLQFEYDAASEEIVGEIAYSFENEKNDKAELESLRDYFVNDAIAEIERMFDETGEYRYLNDVDHVMNNAPLRTELILSDLTAELTFE